jgi:hypothetical protein
MPLPLFFNPSPDGLRTYLLFPIAVYGMKNKRKNILPIKVNYFLEKN